MTKGQTNAALPPICGFDIGAENSYIGVARQGGLEIILNDYSQRYTPGYVSLTSRQRELGVSAKQKHFMNISSTYFLLKRLVGRPYAEVQKTEQLPFPYERAANGEIGVAFENQEGPQVYSATQLLAMFLTKLKQLANNPTDCVINCPNYFTESQRRALRDAAYIAGLNPLRILPDLTAVALYYCFYRAPSAVSSDHGFLFAFVDIGYSSTQCSVVYYDPKKGNVQVLAVDHESNLGGKHFDELIAGHFIQEKNLQLSKRSYLRLVAEAEKLKKQMSANSNDLPINVECLYDDRDFSSKMSRATFEQLAEKHFEAMRQVFARTLENAKTSFASLQKNVEQPIDFKLTSCEVVGGSSRIPAVKRMVKQVFGVDASTTLNADEAVALGCTLHCAMISPNFKVAKDLQLIDYASYQINCRYWHVINGEQAKVYTISPLFVRGDQMPFTRQIIINCHSFPLVFELEYVNKDGQPDVLGQWQVTAYENIDFTTNKMKVRVRLDNNGLVGLVNAVLQVEDKTPEQATDGQEPMELDAGDDKAAAKPNVRSVELKVEPLWVKGKLNDQELDCARNVEANLMLADKNWNERIDARNALEEYVYEWRDKVEDDRFSKFIDPSAKANLVDELRSMERWLLDDEDSGEIQSRNVYTDRLNKLKVDYTDAILIRLREFESRDSFLEKLGKVIQMGYKLLETDELVDATKLDTLKKDLQATQDWFEQAHSTFNTSQSYDNPTITTKDIQNRIDTLDRSVKAVFDEIAAKRQERQKEEELKKQQSQQQPEQQSPEGQKPEEMEQDQQNTSV